MKKLFSIALSLLMLISCFAISASAEGVNVAPNGTYYYEGEPTFKTDSSMSDDLCELLIDGVVPTTETPFETVAFTGTGAVVTVIFDLGALYSDITDINFLGVCDSYGDDAGGKNRGFSGEKTMFYVSNDGKEFNREKSFEMSRVAIEDAANMYNFCFKFDSAITAQYVKVIMYSPVYVLSLGDIEIISASGEGSEPAPFVSEEESAVESTEESAVESTDESAVESTDESAVESADESAAASADESAAASADESKADSSKEESSKAPTSSTADNDDKGGISPVVIVIIILVVIAIAVAVLIIMKKRK